jgi:pyruvate formate lyase activating enzyme
MENYCKMSASNFHEAILWTALSGEKVQCNACAHRCIIAEGKYGLCGTRKNINGSLFTNVYEFPLAVHVDPIEKKPLFHFLPGSRSLSIGTAGCNFRCSFCQNYDISQMRGDQIFGRHTSIQSLLEQAEMSYCKSIAYTYNEPVVFLEFLLDLSVEAHKRGLKNVYISNGFETKETLKLLAGKIDAMNIDLKAFSEKFYQKQCKGKLAPVLDTIRRAAEMGIWLEITSLIIPGENDTDKEIRQMASFIASVSKKIPWHLSRFFPAFQMTDKPPTPLSRLEAARRIGKEEGLQNIYVGNVPHETNTTYCPHCGKALITRNIYTLTNNDLVDGHCPSCGASIAGIF